MLVPISRTSWLALAASVALGSLIGCASLVEGDTAPDWLLADLAGQTHDFAAYRGQVIILDFWATWCAPCLPVGRFLNSLHAQYGDQGLQILALHYDASGNPGSFAREHGYAYTVFPDGQQVAKLYGVSKIPTLMVIDRDGMIIHRQTGFAETDTVKLKNLIETSL